MRTSGQATLEASSTWVMMGRSEWEKSRKTWLAFWTVPLLAPCFLSIVPCCLTIHQCLLIPSRKKCHSWPGYAQVFMTWPFCPSCTPDPASLRNSLFPVTGLSLHVPFPFFLPNHSTCQPNIFCESFSEIIRPFPLCCGTPSLLCWVGYWI